MGAPRSGKPKTKWEIEMKKARNNKSGFIVTAELLLITTILVIGLIVGMVTLRNSMNAELEDVAEAIGDLNQSYNFMGLLVDNTTGTTAGSCYTDEPDDSAADDNDGNSASNDLSNWSFVDCPVNEAGIGAGTVGFTADQATP
jgi:hypothetical protein